MWGEGKRFVRAADEAAWAWGFNRRTTRLEAPKNISKILLHQNGELLDSALRFPGRGAKQHEWPAEN